MLEVQKVSRGYLHTLHIKPFGALNALENKVITINKNEILWNGDEYPFPQWNENQSLNSAMKNS